MHKINTYFLIITWILLITNWRLYSANATDTIRHDVSSSIRWETETTTYDHYVTNGELRPTKTETSETERFSLTGSYTLFWPPVAEKPGIPLALRKFYARSSCMNIQGTLQPRTKTTNIHRDPALEYIRSVHKDEQSQGVDFALEYYLRPRTAFLAQFITTKAEETAEIRYTAPYLNDRGTGTNEELRRNYRFGISHYPTDDVNVSLLYTLLDFAYRGREKMWAEDRPILFSRLFLDSDTNGYTLSLSGEYITNVKIGIQGKYEWSDYYTRSDYLSTFSDNFPTLDTSYKDHGSRHTWQMLTSFYIGEKTTLRVGGKYTTQHVKQVHELDRIDEYDWRVVTLEAGLLYYVNRYFGIHTEYKFARQAGDSLIWHPEAEGDPRTTFEIGSTAHSIFIGLQGMF